MLSHTASQGAAPTGEMCWLEGQLLVKQMAPLIKPSSQQELTGPMLAVSEKTKTKRMSENSCHGHSFSSELRHIGWVVWGGQKYVLLLPFLCL